MFWAISALGLALIITGETQITFETVGAALGVFKKINFDKLKVLSN